MSLREKLGSKQGTDRDSLLSAFGVLYNPFPTANQTLDNPHYPVPEDDEAEEKIITFLREMKSEVLVVLGTQGVGKTNFLNYLDDQIQEVKDTLDGYYIVRYLADPEPSFDATVRMMFLEFGTPHLKKVAESLAKSHDALSTVRSYDLREALSTLSNSPDDDERLRLCQQWLFGSRLLKAHRDGLGVNFRLDTVESRTAALRDYIMLSAELGLLKGIFLLLDELEKQAGVLGPTAVVRYLSGLRAIMDALPKHLFLIIAVTPDAMRRYSSALPAFRSRLENQIELRPLAKLEEAMELAEFYLEKAKSAVPVKQRNLESRDLVTQREMSKIFNDSMELSKRRGDDGVRQREFLNGLHDIAEKKIQERV